MATAGRSSEAAGARRPKLAHVAIAAGVSIGTASDALRGRGRMSDGTRERVVAAAETLGYRANANARILASDRTQVVALVMQRPEDESEARIYWPRVQAAFTERLFREGLVACTMNVTDLHQLDGLPFDLIVHAAPQNTQPLPDEIRAAYHIMDLDLAGSGLAAIALREQVRQMVVGVFNELTEQGASHPALVIASDPIVPIEWLVTPYEDWCRSCQIDPLSVVPGDGSPNLIPEAADAAFRSFVSARPSDRAARTAVPEIQLVAQAAHGLSSSVRQLTIDGSTIGTRLADNAIAFLRGQPTQPLSLAWLLDDKPWTPAVVAES